MRKLFSAPSWKWFCPLHGCHPINGFPFSNTIRLVSCHLRLAKHQNTIIFTQFTHQGMVENVPISGVDRRCFKMLLQCALRIDVVSLHINLQLKILFSYIVFLQSLHRLSTQLSSFDEVMRTANEYKQNKTFGTSSTDNTLQKKVSLFSWGGGGWFLRGRSTLYANIVYPEWRI